MRGFQQSLAYQAYYQTHQRGPDLAPLPKELPSDVSFDEKQTELLALLDLSCEAIATPLDKIIVLLNTLYCIDKDKLQTLIRKRLLEKALKSKESELILLLASFDRENPSLQNKVLFDAMADSKKTLFCGLLTIGVTPTISLLEEALSNPDTFYLSALLNIERYPQCLYDKQKFYDRIVTKEYYNSHLYQYRKKTDSRLGFFIKPSSPLFVWRLTAMGMIIGGLSGLVLWIAVLCAAPFGGLILPILAKLSLAVIKGLTLNLDGLYHFITDLAATGYGDVLIPFVFIVLVILIAMPYILPPLLSSGAGLLAGGLLFGVGAYVMDRALTALKEGIEFVCHLFGKGETNTPREGLEEGYTLGDSSVTPEC